MYVFNVAKLYSKLNKIVLNENVTRSCSIEIWIDKEDLAI